MILLSTLLQILYAVSVVGLAVYGFHALWMSWQVRKPPPKPAAALPSLEEWPAVTIQLPIYNELHVVDQLIDACARQNYPRHRLQIQVLDDSTDQTSVMVQKRLDYWRAQGVAVQQVLRTDRTGFKAGALAHALPQASGDFIAIFDADFAPPSDFLRNIIPHFLAQGGEKLAFIQGRWEHLNRDYSPLTRSQALALDGHFAVEQAGRQAAGYFFGFNGSAGVWRRSCIEDPAVGGWQIDTLCEDLDLSYRAQMAGWQPLYLNHVGAPAEIPPQLGAFKRQQFRWAKGSIQTLRKLGGRVWRDESPLEKRLAALFHLGSYLLHPMLLTLLLVSLPLMLLGADPAAAFTLLSVSAIGPPLLYGLAQRRLHPRAWLGHVAFLPMLMLLGTGLCLNNTIAVWQGLRERGGQFLRTPKFNVAEAGDGWKQSSYRLPLEPLVLGELGLMLYALGAAVAAGWLGKWWTVPFMLLYAGGFGLMFGMGVAHSWLRRTRRQPATGSGRVKYEQDRVGA